MTLWRTYYHLVWATHQRYPLITDTCEASLYQYIEKKATSLNCSLHAINGMADHIHLVVSIPPNLAISEFVKSIKGGSSRYMNQTYTENRFAWQREYGVFSLGSKQLESAISYVQNQKRHHAESTMLLTLEPDVLINQKLKL